MVLFVYYKFEQGQFAMLMQQISQLRAAISMAYPSICMRVMKRPGMDDKGRETWMEMYELAALDFESFVPFLEKACVALSMPTGRATELFEDV